jgi:hypothetical protein
MYSAIFVHLNVLCFFVLRPQYIMPPRKMQARARKNAATDRSATALTLRAWDGVTRELSFE